MMVTNITLRLTKFKCYMKQTLVYTSTYNEIIDNNETLTWGTENGHEIHFGNKMLLKSDPLNQASMLRSGTKDRKKVTEEMGHW